MRSIHINMFTLNLKHFLKKGNIKAIDFDRFYIFFYISRSLIRFTLEYIKLWEKEKNLTFHSHFYIYIYPLRSKYSLLTVNFL